MNKLNKYLVTSLLIGVLGFAGCAAIDRAFNGVAPNQKQIVTTTDQTTNQQINSTVEVPGTHALTPQAQAIVNGANSAATAAGFPFLGLIIAAGLGIVNFFQRAKNGKLMDALTSTVQTIENAGNDPTLAPAIATLKAKLATSHQIAGIQPIVNDILAGLKMLPTIPVK